MLAGLSPASLCLRISEDTLKPTSQDAAHRYAMEFVAGETLENLIKRSGPLEVKLALEIATQLAASLAAVHKQKLVQRDIKPSNIMVSLEEGG
ncbi:MAG TPA: protein kinase [Chthoniobacterales bacterium]|nr:protein kinase [Chthoniobacterales bacterium]